MAPLAISHSAASWRQVVGTALLGLAFRQGRAVIKNSVFCWLPLSVCQRFYFISCAVSAAGCWKTFFSHGILFCVPLEENVALRKESTGVVLDCPLPHLVGIDEDLLSTGVILCYLKVKRTWEHNSVPLYFSKQNHFALVNCSACPTAAHTLYPDFLNLQEGRTLIGSDEASCSQGIGESRLLFPTPHCCVICWTENKHFLFYAFIFHCIVVLHGPGLLGEHCVLENCAGIVTLIPQDGALCSVNGSAVTDPCQLTQGKHFCKADRL